MAEEKSRILIIGATGSLGHRLVHASLESGHPTFALVRPSSFSQPPKADLLHTFKEAGVKLIHGSLQDWETLMEAVKQVDVVICAVPMKNVLEQKLLIQAIKQAGCIKRFIPSEFGADPDKAQVHDLDHGFYAKKSEIRRAIEKEGIPYTYISCNFFMRILLPSLVQPGLKKPPRESIKIFGDGNTKAVFMNESDVATFTLCTVDDPRALNKIVYLRPPGNACSINELIEMWESKIARKLEKSYISGEQLLQSIKGYSCNKYNSQPGLAFGTGEHPTTKLCLLLLHGLIGGGESFLDYGTDSGIMAIAALKVLAYGFQSMACLCGTFC